MRVSREQVQENRRLILKVAAQLFKERGYESVSVIDVMKAAGLTHGGFYGYFKSKNDLIAQSLADTFSQSQTKAIDIETLLDEYLSPEHRDNCANGCPTAALAIETARQTSDARQQMTEGLKTQLSYFSEKMPGEDLSQKRNNAIGMWSSMVGALILSRVSEDEDLSKEILKGAQIWLKKQLNI